MKDQLTLLFLIISFLLACKAIPADPAAMPTPTRMTRRTPTRFPTSTPIPIIEFLPTENPEQMEPGGFRMPIGEPVESWNGVPIMPGAIAGDSDEYLYYFTIHATVEEIQAYYKRELKKAGADNCYGFEDNGRGFAPLTCVFRGNPLKTVYVDVYDYGGFMLVVVDVQLQRW